MMLSLLNEIHEFQLIEGSKKLHFLLLNNPHILGPPWTSLSSINSAVLIYVWLG